MKKLTYKLRYLVFVCLFYLKHPTQLYKHVKVLLNRKKLVIHSLDFEASPKPKVSILILTYGALDYVKKCLESLNKFRPENVEVIVYDNGSDEETKNYLKEQLENKVIDKLKFSEVNHFFVKGNNEAAKLAAEDSEYLLLLNSDTEILHKDWLNILLSIHPKKGIASLGAVFHPVPRPDGWCFLVDTATFKELGGLNEHFQMNWGITDFTAKALKEGLKVNTIFNPHQFIVHYGGKSYKKKPKINPFTDMTEGEVINLFSTGYVKYIKIHS